MHAARATLRDLPATTVHLLATDFNRQRWMIRALRNHALLRQSLARSAQDGQVRMIDSTVMARLNEAPKPGTHVVLWDGLNSWLELLQQRPAWCAPDNLVPLCVGLFAETRAALPRNALPLFDQSPGSIGLLAECEQVAAPLAHDLRAWLQARLRPVRNWRISAEGHRLLAQGGQLVFCGLVQPSAKVLDGFMRGSQLAQEADAWQPLATMVWRGQPEQVRTVLARLLPKLQQSMHRSIDLVSGADWACAYTLLNVMQRMAVLSLISARTPDLFVNEFVKQQHLDPYDAASYYNNVFLDFGSTRGPDLLYPRSVDLWLNGKSPLNLRLLQSGDSLNQWLESQSLDAFWQHCSAQADSALARRALMAAPR